ncbi:uncharacterized protein LOC100119416 [Nasonia vitripennis]|uniref:G domain-containing protein n=1 Tax=Nasonia vitripennis TaxID=7425 RepID=A0A7M7G4G5_NASVI|nr:uncharacterized protein LOC100119416 [Nasonia vitripennis]
MASEVTQRSKEETMNILKELKQNLKDAEETMREKVKHEDVAMFVGSTKAGKSTLINYFIGNPLVGRKDSAVKGKFNPTKVYKASSAEGPEIGCESASATTMPSRWIASEKFSNLVMWDCPGFCDNRGPAQAITNAYYIHHIFQKIKSVKIVLVVDLNDIIQHKINPFITLLTSVENVFKEKIEQCYSSFAVIFTKVPFEIEEDKVDIDYLVDILRRQVLSSSALSISKYSRNLVQFFVDHPRNIGFVRKATGGVISGDIEVNLLQAVRDATRVPDTLLKQFSFPSIDSDSKVFLFEVRNDLSSKKTFEEVVEVVKSVLKNILSYFENVRKNKGLPKGQLHAEKQKLCKLRNQIESSSTVAVDVFTKLQVLKQIDPIIRDKIENSEIEDTLRLMTFIDGLLNMKESDLCNLNLKSIMETVASQMSKIVVEMQCDLHEIDMKEANRQIDAIKEEYEKKMQEIKVEAKEAAEHNLDVTKKLGFAARAGHAVDKAVEAVGNASVKVAEAVYNVADSIISFFW